MHSEDEANIIKAGAKGRMKATPLTVGNDKGKKVLAYTRRRSSKVFYQSVLTGEKMASENYQVMNYGMGGTFKIHTDVEEGLKHNLKQNIKSTIDNTSIEHDIYQHLSNF